MEIERLVGVDVVDEAQYQAYRDGMRPILEQYGGRFTVDVRVSEVLLAPDEGSFNRLFTIRFPSEDAMNAFFSDPAYVAVRDEFFVPSVRNTASLRKYAVEP
jgi:uncharacterized protein (DUF1330 family)